MNEETVAISSQPYNNNIMEDDNTDAGVVQPPFEMGNYHKKALITLLHLYHNNRQTLTYKELSLRLDVGEKTKAWQCEAWKDLKSNGYIVSAESDKKTWELSPDGVALASTLATPEELAEFQIPDTNEKLHEKIRAKLMRLREGGKYGVKIFDLMLSADYTPLSRHELAAKFDILADSHGFFYGLKGLKDMGYVVFCNGQEINDLKRHVEETKVKAATTTRIKEEANNDNKDNEKPVKLSSMEEDTKRKASAMKDNDNETGDHQDKPKKKKYKSKQKRSGGKPLKLADKAYVNPPK